MDIVAGVIFSVGVMLFFVQMRLYDIREELKEMNRLKRRELDGRNTNETH